ncbi:putative FAD-dependent urate hydroxylase-like [Cocos nucifera]|nr:putative FAD-dependent urate hydroxylase-like [Cocos nucifera]
MKADQGPSSRDDRDGEEQLSCFAVVLARNSEEMMPMGCLEASASEMMLMGYFEANASDKELGMLARILAEIMPMGKGVKSLVLERSERIRATGAAIGIFMNGWCALDRLGVGAVLRDKTIPIPEVEELRCLKRSDLIQVLFDNLSVDSVRLGCQIVAVERDPSTSFPILYVHDGNPDASKDPKFIMELAMQQINDYPARLAEMIEMVKSSDPSSLNLTSIRYRSPWHLVFRNFRRGTMTVAGDAMHMMGPFLGQGGCVALEDAVVLARNLAQAMPMGVEGGRVGDGELKKRIETALENYVKERKPRVLRLAVQSMLVRISRSSQSKIKRLLSLALLLVFFGGASLGYTRFDCGPL